MAVVTKTHEDGGNDDDCFYYHSWRNNAVIAFGTLSSCPTVTCLHIVSGVVYIESRVFIEN